MHVAHIGNYKPDSPNGVDKTIVGLVRHLPMHAIRTEVWHPTQRAGVVRERTGDGISICDLPVRKAVRGISRFGKDAKAFVRARAESVDLLHFHSVFLGENLQLARLGVPYVVTPNGGYDRLVLSGRHRLAKAVWLKLWERPFLERARMIQAVSLPERETIEKLGLGVPVRYIPNGMDDAVLGREAPPPSRASHFVFLGRLAPEQKGLDLLLKGYAKAAAQASGLPRLVLAGPGFRDGHERLAAMTRELGIAERVDFPGAVFGEDKWRLLSQARLFIHTSRWEGMPFALLEAMAVGRPVLITPGTNVAEQVAEADAGIVVAGDIDAIAGGLARAASLPCETLDAMGRRARSMVEAKFSWRMIAGELARAYRAALAA